MTGTWFALCLSVKRFRLCVQNIEDLRVLGDIEFCKYEHGSLVKVWDRKAVMTVRFSSVLYSRSKWCLIKCATVCVRLAVYFQFSWQKQLVLDTLCVVEQSLWHVVSTCHGWSCDIVGTLETPATVLILRVKSLDERAIGIFLSIKFRRMREYVVNNEGREVMRCSLVAF